MTAEFGGAQIPNNGFSYPFSNAVSQNIKSVDIQIAAADVAGLSTKTLWVPDTVAQIIGIAPLPSVNYDGGGSVQFYLSDPISWNYDNIVLACLCSFTLTNILGDWVPGLNYFPWELTTYTPYQVSPTNPLTLFTSGASDYSTGSLNFRVFYL